MYPLNMHNPESGGFAVANDSAEHKALSEYGYLPPLKEEEPEPVKRGPGRPKKAAE